MQLSVIDLSLVPTNGDRKEAVKNSLETAQKVEKWGYKRIWFAEHHGSAGIVGRAPEVMIPYIATQTKHIRVGSGTVLLNHYSPYKVAENFTALEEMFPGRIDMGIGRATVGPLGDIALQRNRSFRQMTDDSDEQLEELTHWLNNDFDDEHPFRNWKLHHQGIPDLWVSGSSAWSAGAAAKLGLQYAFAGFINPGQAFAITQKYKKEFRASQRMGCHTEPKLILGIGVYCGETEEDAARLAAPCHFMYKNLYAGGDINRLMEDEEKAIEGLGFLPRLTETINPQSPPREIIGTPEMVKEQLNSIVETFGADEIIVQCIHPNLERKLHSLELLAKTMNLQQL